MSLTLLPLVIVEAALLLAGAYLLGLTLAGFLYRRPALRGHSARTRFAVLVPAHNEEQLLPRLLSSLHGTDYPRELVDVYVVADNCSDATAQVGRLHGAQVFERYDDELRGKGYALRWLLDHVRAADRSCDAYLLLDADCVVSPGFLAVMDARVQEGSRVVQSYYTAAEPFRSSASALRFVALTLMHFVRPRGRQALGLSCGLFGSGMVFSKEVLDAHGWDSFTLAEDVEYYLKLTAHGIRVDFAPEAIVSSEMPASLREARTQNLRWEAGRLRMALRHGLRLLGDGMLRLDFSKVDAGVQQIIPPLSVTVMLALLALGVSLAVRQTLPVVLGATASLALLAHVFLGLASAGAPARAYRSFAWAPVFVLWKCWLYVLALRPMKMRWVRTERPNS